MSLAVVGPIDQSKFFKAAITHPDGWVMARSQAGYGQVMDITGRLWAAYRQVMDLTGRLQAAYRQVMRG